ncbi:MAG: DUF2141 domain-containing protein [Rhodospirillum sp.]|nr:DUF2141 domain-containing protein [Rhodospirillum sp.]MCF8487787.1 DUF2141 domain-containing protein [Rhodospirillum sp.]MCF8502236.1 DUF2141 domain-containing protein [Rhodospirillum sp.]
MCVSKIIATTALALCAVLSVMGDTPLAVAGSNGGTLAVAITGLRSDKGLVRLALYDQADRFPKRDGVIRTIRVSPDGEKAEALFTDLPEGRYAIAFFHDENDNGKFDQGLLGVPMEGFGFSRDARVLLGPPSFEDAALTVRGPAPKLIIAKMRY